jgi:hypothetical protein
MDMVPGTQLLHGRPGKTRSERSDSLYKVQPSLLIYVCTAINVQRNEARHSLFVVSLVESESLRSVMYPCQSTST